MRLLWSNYVRPLSIATCIFLTDNRFLASDILMWLFRGRKVLQISQFCSYTFMKVFSAKFGAWHLLTQQSEKSAKVFSTKIVFSTNLQKFFFPSKVFHYTVVIPDCQNLSKTADNSRYQKLNTYTPEENSL